MRDELTPPSEEMLDAIIRRCDTDGDMALNYLEFSEVVSWPVGFKQMYLPA